MSGKFTLSEDVRGVFKKISLELKRTFFCYVIIILMPLLKTVSDVIKQRNVFLTPQGVLMEPKLHICGIHNSLLLIKI
jgi:hypothetical protein